MKSIILLAVLCALPSFFVQAAATQAQNSKDRHTEAEVRQLNAEEVTAFLNKDSKTRRAYGPMISSSPIH
ncbi:MAG: hypothetical protein ABI145_11300 [Steroidobacteraceae bacterium]